MEIQYSNGGFPLGLSMSNGAVCPEGLLEVEERTLKVTATARLRLPHRATKWGKGN